MIATIRSISSYVCWNRRSEPPPGSATAAAALRPRTSRVRVRDAALEIVAPRRPGQHVELDDLGQLREQERPLRRDAADRDRRRDMGGSKPIASCAPARSPACSVRARCSERSTPNANAARTAPDSAGAPLCSSMPYDSTMTGSVATFRRKSAAANGLRARFAVQMNATRAVIDATALPSSARTVSERYLREQE